MRGDKIRPIIKRSDFLSHHFANKRICLTGGTDGIGLALAHLLVAHGAEMLIIGKRPAHEALLPDGSRYFEADLSKPQSVEKIATHITALGWETLDHLIHNAGIGYVGPISSQTSGNIEAIIEANLKSPLALSALLFSLLERKNGSVCFIGSTVTGRATPEFALYTATKTGIADIARNLRTEWSGRVRVQEIHPGPTRTGFHAKAGLEYPPMASLFMTPEEVATIILKTLINGKGAHRITLAALLFHAFKRCFMGKRP